jgi:DNA-binding response OmpR family regulator
MVHDRSSGEDGSSGALPRVLVVDDHVDALAFLGRLLSAVPVDAVPVATCEAARYAARTLAGFDVVIADCALSDGDGVTLAAELKRAHGCATLILSGREPPAGGLPEGIDLWIVKPVRLPQLREAIRTLMAA